MGRIPSAWGVIVAANLLALLLTLLFAPYIEPSPYPLFAIAIAVSVKYAGAPGGTVSVLYATVATEYFFLPPFHSVSLGPEDLSRAAMFTFVAAIVGAIAFGQRRTAQTAFRLAAIVESSEDAIIGKRLDGTIISWNAAAERLFGYSADEVIGRSILMLVPRHRHDETRAILQSIRQGQRVAHFETERVTKNGRVVKISLSLSPIRDQAGTIVGASAVERDTTERRQAEATVTRLSSAVEQTDDSVIITDRDGIIEYVNPAFERLTGYTRADAVGHKASILKSGRQGQDFYAGLWNSILSGQVFRAEMVNRKKNGEFYHEAKTITPIRDNSGVITHFVSTGKDITERILAYEILERQVEERTREVAQLYQQADQRSRELEALYRADEELYRHLHLDKVLQALVNVVVDLLDADKATVQVWDNDRERLIVRAARGYSAATVALLSTNGPGDGIAGQVFVKREPMAVEDARHAPPPADSIAEVEGIHSVLSVPITIGDKVFGVFGVAHGSPRSFGPDEQRLFLALAQRAALAIQNARLYEQAEQAATLGERHRLARELHDSVTQSLYSLTLLAEAGKRMAATGDFPQVQHNVTRLSDTAQQALKEMRLMVYELRAPELETKGLVGALRHRLDAVEQHAGIHVCLHAEGGIHLPAVYEEELYRIAQEALNNSLKHAHATSTTVNLCAVSDTAEMRIEDDGRGFDPATAGEGGGMGLSNMRERTQRLGGEFVVHSARGQGTSIMVRVRIPGDQVRTSQGEWCR